MLKTDRVIVVEGKYDAIKLANIVDALIIRTDGFGIFQDKEKQALLRRLAETRGLLVLTDSDSAGFLIRNFLGNAVPKEYITNVYIPDIYGKERRKTQHSAEGKLGVEGIPDGVLVEALKKAGVTDAGDQPPEDRQEITRMDFYRDGLQGKQDSAARRQQVLRELNLPERMTGKQLLQVMNMLLTYEEYRALVTRLFS